MKIWLLLLALGLSTPSNAQTTEVALTFDDLPYVETLPSGYSRIKLIEDTVAVLKKHGIEGVVAFVNGERVARSDEEGPNILDTWVKAGHYVANHTWAHADLNKTSAWAYTKEIEQNDRYLQQFGDRYLKLFRYPYLHEGNSQENRDYVRNYLTTNGYKIAQVTIDYSDWMWSEPQFRCTEFKDHKAIETMRTSYNSEAQANLRASQLLANHVFGKAIKHIALIHPFAMSVEELDNVLAGWKKAGVKFISLQEALQDPVYEINPNVVTDTPYTFLNQVRVMKGLRNPPEVSEIFQRSLVVEQNLEKVCVDVGDSKYTFSCDPVRNDAHVYMCNSGRTENLGNRYVEVEGCTAPGQCETKSRLIYVKLAKGKCDYVGTQEFAKDIVSCSAKFKLVPDFGG